MPGEWDAAYSTLDRTHYSLYGDPATYKMAAEFFRGHGSIEDWGCGGGAFRAFVPVDQSYRGVDGSKTPFADEIVDLATYRSRSDCILLRHVLEHSYDWEKILTNAVASFRQRLCVILFTPLIETTASTEEIEEARLLMTEPDYDDVPVLSFRLDALARHWLGFPWSHEVRTDTRCAYGVEHVLCVTRP